MYIVHERQAAAACVIKAAYFRDQRTSPCLYRGILVYNICLISISNSVFDGVTNKSVLNIERS